MPARSFRLVSFCFEVFCLETDSCKVFHCQSEPKDAELRPRLAQEEDRVLCFSHGSGAPEESTGAVKCHGHARARREVLSLQLLVLSLRVLVRQHKCL